jgi:hypothetical protein
MSCGAVKIADRGIVSAEAAARAFGRDVISA